jgi:predicted nucleic acid-binding protein
LTSFVIDASVAIKWYLPEEDRMQAITLLRLARSGKMAFHVPDLIYCEAANILWKRVRFGELTEPESAAIASALVDVPKTVHRSEELLSSALQIACILNRPAYDCFYLALAEFLGSVLITADKKLVNALAGTPWQQVVVSIHAAT